MVHTTDAFVSTRLPKGQLPNYQTAQSDITITIPFAVNRYSDGLDICEDDDGNEYAYQDEPPSWYLAGAFLTRDEAEEFIRSEKARGVTKSMEIEENYTVAYWQFTYCYIPEPRFRS